MVLKKSVVALLAAIVGLSWVQALPAEHRKEINHPHQLGNSIDGDIQNDYIGSLEDFTTSTTSLALKPIEMVIPSPRTEEDPSKERTFKREGKFKTIRTPKFDLEFAQFITETNAEIESMWDSTPCSDRIMLLNLRQTLCNIASEVDMPLDVQDIICKPLEKEKAM